MRCTAWIRNGRDPAAPPAPDPQELARSIQSLRTVAERTGGFALVDTNDFAAPFQRIIQENSAYYVLGYSPTNQGRPGEYRRIMVRTRPGLRVSARPGYVVPPPRNQPPASPVMAAIDDSLPRPQLPIRVQAVPLPGRDGTSSDVQVIVEVDGGGLTFRSEGGAHVERVAFALKTVDDLAREANRTSTDTTLRLTEAERDRTTRAGVRWMTTLGLAPGHHSVRVAAHADTAGRTGSVFADVEVPGIGRDEVWLSRS
jgi:hypothetical protein